MPGSEGENQLHHHQFFQKMELPAKAQLTLDDIVSWPKAETKALLSHRAVPVGSWFIRKSNLMGYRFSNHAERKAIIHHRRCCLRHSKIWFD